MSQQRLYLGKEHEQKVQRSLEARGWHVSPWGQGVLSDEVRQAFIERDAGIDVLLWRWLPDMIAVRGRDTFLVEAKTEQRTDTANFAIEIRCIAAQLAMKPLGLDTYIVWADGTCNRPQDLRPVDIILPNGRGRRVVDVNGSGTAFALVLKSEQLPMDQVFGPRITERGAA